MQQTCRDCALPWVGAPCANCGSGEPAAVRPPAPPAAVDPADDEPKPKAGNGKKPAKKAAPARVSTTVPRVSTTVDGPGGTTTVRIV